MTERGAHTGVTSDHASEHEILRCLVGGGHRAWPGARVRLGASSEFTNSAPTTAIVATVVGSMSDAPATNPGPSVFRVAKTRRGPGTLASFRSSAPVSGCSFPSGISSDSVSNSSTCQHRHPGRPRNSTSLRLVITIFGLLVIWVRKNSMRTGSLSSSSSPFTRSTHSP